MKIKSIAEANEVLLSFVPTYTRLTVKNTNLDRVWPLMELVGNPQDELKIVHIAGTSGKTSTAYYMAALLAASGLKVGLGVSPHIDSVTERVQINGAPLADEVFCEELGIFLDLIADGPVKPTYFELLYMFTMWELVRQKVDYAVIETGLGGLYDATNVARRADKVCIITDIGFDHTALLGNTLTAIATQKAGIIHEGNQVFMYRQVREVVAVIESRVQQKQAKLQLIEPAALSQSSLFRAELADYQRRNWYLAYQAYIWIAKHVKLPHLTRQVLQQTQALQVPARMDTRQSHGKTIIMDGAHNGQKIAAFIQSYKTLYPDTKPVLLVAFREGKEYQEAIPLLAELSDHIITTTFATTQDMLLRSVDPTELGAAFREAGVANVIIEPDHAQAYEKLITSSETVGVITGSFYLLGQIRQLNTD